MFMLALTLTWAPATVHRIYTAISGQPTFFWTIFGTVCVSLQGFFNMLAYLHPRCARLREERESVGCRATLRFLVSLDDQLDVRHRASCPAASAPSDDADRETGVLGAGSSASCFKSTMVTLPRFASCSRSERGMVHGAMVHAASDGSAESSACNSDDPDKAGKGQLDWPAEPEPAEPEPAEPEPAEREPPRAAGHDTAMSMV
jgi:hypothetical protein